jgi:hypothetical protein
LGEFISERMRMGAIDQPLMAPMNLLGRRSQDAE